MTEQPRAAVPTWTVVTSPTNSRPALSSATGGRQPLLWAALAFAAGIVTGVHAWRPPLWWVVAWIVFALSGACLLGRRSRSAFLVGLGSLFFLGALMIQLRGPDNAGNPGGTPFAGGTEVIVTAHVSKEGTLQEDGPGSFRQRIDVETEQITRGDGNSAVNSGLLGSPGTELEFAL